MRTSADRRPYAGAWIETSLRKRRWLGSVVPLRGGVDRNYDYTKEPNRRRHGRVYIQRVLPLEPAIQQEIDKGMSPIDPKERRSSCASTN